MSADKLRELTEILSHVSEDSPISIKQEIFNFIRKFWAEFGEAPDIQEKVCAALKISPQEFNLLLLNPEIVYGSEVLNRNLKDGWLKDYVYYTAGHEAPEDFHVWVAITIVGACIRRKAWFDNVFYNLYPNLYTILVAPPGIGKKTTAINIGVSLLRAADPTGRIISEKVTPEALAKSLSKPTEHAKESGGLKIDVSAEGLLVAPELTVFLGREQYNEGLILFLTRLYDCADVQEVETISRGKEKLRNVCVSMLGATTPSEIHNAIGKSAKGSGFMSRLNIIQKDSSPRVVPFAVKPDPTVKEMLINKLQKIVDEVKGEFRFSGTAREWYIDYYKRHNQAKHSSKKPIDNIERQPDQLLKLAMCMCASEQDDMQISEDILQRSFNLLAIAAKNNGETMRMIDATERGKLVQKVLQVLKEHGGVVQRSVLIKNVYRHGLSSKELDQIMETLQDGDIILPFFSSKKKYYKLKTLEDVE
jgi:hypothetical protein